MLPIARRSASKLNATRHATKRPGAITLGALGLSAVAALATTALSAGTASAATTASHPGYTARVILSAPAADHLRGGRQAPHRPAYPPDDITAAGPYLFTAFQNGVGPQGQPPPTATGTARSWSSPALAGSSGMGHPR